MEGQDATRGGEVCMELLAACRSRGDGSRHRRRADGGAAAMPQEDDDEDEMQEEEAMPQSNDAVRCRADAVRACAASGNDDLAIASLLDRPSAQLAEAAGAALWELVRAAAADSDGEEVLRLASVGVHAFGLAVASELSKHGVPLPGGGRSSSSYAAGAVPAGLPADYGGGVGAGVGRCSWLSRALGAATRSRLLPPTAALTAHAAASPSLAAALSQLHRFECVVARMAEAYRLRPSLRLLDVAQYATDDAVRADAVRTLASSAASEEAFARAIALAPSVGLDVWELHMACVRHSLMILGEEEAEEEAVVEGVGGGGGGGGGQGGEGKEGGGGGGGA